MQITPGIIDSESQRGSFPKDIAFAFAFTVTVTEAWGSLNSDCQPQNKTKHRENNQCDQC
jgi:hypothetical protein